MENNRNFINYGYLYEMYVLVIDLFFSILGVILTLPIFIIVSLLIKIEDGGPIIYTQDRVGKDGKHFKIYKFRSMKVSSESLDMWALKNDDRITKVGRVIRRTRIDELPQFINILKRDMSLIGPRPEIPSLTEKFHKEIGNFKQRLKIKPGITGWAQVNGGYDLNPKEKLEKDIFYIKNRSIKLDLIIILKTILVIFNGKGAR